MAQNPIQWFPGHMAKTRRLLKECLPKVDIVIELLDARIPYSSKNPEIREIIGDKPKLTVMTKAGLANPDVSKKWLRHFDTIGEKAVLIDSVSSLGISDLSSAVSEVLSAKIERYQNKGMEGRRLKAIIVGIPNVGKSSLINRIAGSKKAKVENRPGVTLSNQWVPTSVGLDLLDTPGILWPKFEDERVGFKLAATGAIKDHILDTEEIAMLLCSELLRISEKEFTERYKLDPEEARELDSYDLFRLVGKKRGFLISGGDIDHKRTAEMLLEEFRSAKIGRISLELP